MNAWIVRSVLDARCARRLETELVYLTLQLAVLGLLIFHLPLGALYLQLQAILLSDQVVDLGLKLLLVARSQVEVLDGVLNLVEAPLTFLFELAALPLVLLLALTPERVHRILLLLVELEFAQLELPLLLLTSLLHLLVFASQLHLKLLALLLFVLVQV